MQSLLDRYFHITERGSTLRTELFGGLITFITMAYIIVINPAILSFAGLPTGASTTATALVACLGCLLMGLWVNRPIAVAPYMGENAFLAFGLAAFGLTWQQRLGTVCLSGILLLALTLCGLRRWLSSGISHSMKNSFAVGIGLFMVFIGLYETGIITSFVRGMPWQALADPGTGLLKTPDVPVKIGSLHQMDVALSVFGLGVLSVLLCRKTPGAIFIGMALTAVAGFLCGKIPVPQSFFASPFQEKYSLTPVLGQLDFSAALDPSMAAITFTLFLMVFLDTLATLTGLGAASGILDKEGNFPDIQKPMLVDAITTTVAPLLGTSTSGAYIESATGIREGARTGLAAVVTGLLFVAALFALPLIEPLQSLRFIYGPALVAVGFLMMDRLSAIDYHDWTESIPALVTIGLMTFTYNIANGMAAGLLVYPLLKIATNRWRELHAGSLVLASASLLYFLRGAVH